MKLSHVNADILKNKTKQTLQTVLKREELKAGSSTTITHF